MNNEIIIPELNNETIESMIYIIRGQKVMLDFELARIYGYETKRFNEQVKNNIDKFPERYRFQLSNEEVDYIARSKKSTAQMWTIGNKGGRTSLPYVFTEQGIYMIMTVLKGELATKQSIILIDTFKQMKDYLIESNNLISSDELLKLTSKVYSNEKNIEKLKNDNKVIKQKLEVVMDNFIDPKTYKHFIFFKGERLDADVAFQKIFALAKHTIYIIDNYIDIKTLQLLKICNPKIHIIIFTDNKNPNNITKEYLNDFYKDTNRIITFKENKIFHDRYIIIDYNYKKEMLFHLGSSIKDTGNNGSEIKQIEDIEIYKEKIDTMINNHELTF